MFSSRAAFFATLLTGATASVTSYAGYEPITVVADHAAIALDQKYLEQYVGTVDGFPIAKAIYEMGGFSKSYAEITLSSAVGANVPKGTTIQGKSLTGKTVTGKALDTYGPTSTVIGFQYPTSDSNENHVMCRQGGLPASEQETSGCLDPAQPISIAGISTSFTPVSIVNKNDRTLKGFSSDTNISMRPGDDLKKDFFPFFVPYVKYYGKHDFADHIIQAGFSGASTVGFDNGTVDLTGYGIDARAQIIKKGTAYISALLYAQRELYDAIYDCEEKCDIAECNADAVNANDEAVAFYVGNQFQGDGMGNLGYALGEKRCVDFGTCVDKPTKGQSKVNERIMREFNAAKIQLAQGQCEAAAKTVQEIVRLMQIPLIQGVLRYAQLTDSFNAPTETMQAEGAIFAAGILPKVHACKSDKAQIIYDNMKLKNGNTKADYKAVRAAFEAVFPCMRITCEEVGGIIDEATGDSYVQGAGPCGGYNVFHTSSASIFSVSGIVVGVMSLVAAIVM